MNMQPSGGDYHHPLTYQTIIHDFSQPLPIDPPPRSPTRPPLYGLNIQAQNDFPGTGSLAEVEVVEGEEWEVEDWGSRRRSKWWKYRTETSIVVQVG